MIRILNQDIVFFTFFGQIKINDIKELLKRINSEPDYSKYFDQVFDFRFCSLIIEIDELPDLVNFVKYEIKIDANRKDIYLTNKRNELVLTTLFGILIENLKIKPYVVSSTEKTIHVLSKPNFDKYNLENILDALRLCKLKKNGVKNQVFLY